MTSAAVEAPDVSSVDANITRVTRVLMAWHDVNQSDVAAAMSTSKATFERRLYTGGYSAREISALAFLFGAPLDAFFTGNIDLSSTRCKWSPKRRGQLAPPSGLEPETCRFMARPRHLSVASSAGRVIPLPRRHQM